jgi:hypothetical protein
MARRVRYCMEVGFITTYVIVEETGEPRENHRLTAVNDKRYHIMLY